MSPPILTDILASTQSRLSQNLEEGVQHLAETNSDRNRSFSNALLSPGLSIIAEIKRRSPSRGSLNTDLDPTELARTYTQAGAAAISVLTEPDFFAGSLSDLVRAKQSTELPVLRKDFLIDASQLTESVRIGADAVLLIVAALSLSQLAELLTRCGELGLDALVEVHNRDEAETAMEIGAETIGVNCRDLNTFATDLTVAEELAPLLTEAKVKVAESGIRTPSDAGRMAAVGYDAILVGESLVTASDPAQLLAELKG